MPDNITTKDVLLTSAPIIKIFVDSFLAPKIEKLKHKLSVEYHKNISGIEKYLAEYFERTYYKYSIINTLVFNNSEKLLKDLFIPLTLIQTSNKEKKYKIDGFPFNLSIESKKILITDTAGMGKSTLVKRILLDIIDKSIGIPIIIELRRLNKDKTILDELHEQLSSINKIFDKKLLLELLNDGDFIFFLDGFDEITLSDRDIVSQDIQKFTSKANHNKFFMTSRPESALSGFGEFQQFSIAHLNKNEAYQLLKNYDGNGTVSTLLIKKLKQSEYKNIEEFLINPLLISLLFTAFEYKQVIPFKKHIFYRQVYDANFESHDLTKGDSYMHDKYSQLDIDDFHRVLRHLGFSCLQIQKIEFTKDELLNLISQSQTFCVGLKFKISDFLNDLISTVPLFTKDGVYYRWSHKSLQEYFAAQFIYLDAKQVQTQILKKISQGLDTDKHYNVLDIYYDIDYKLFRDIVISPLIIEFVARYEKLKLILRDTNENEILHYNELTFTTVAVILAQGLDFHDLKINSLIEKYEKYENIDLQVAETTLRFGLNNKKEDDITSFQFYDNHKLNILSILRSKRNEIIKSSKARLNYHNFGIFEFIMPSKVILIDNNFNQDIIFKDLQIVNKTLNGSMIFSTTINYKKALSMLKTIEKEKAAQTNTESLLMGL